MQDIGFAPYLFRLPRKARAGPGELLSPRDSYKAKLAGWQPPRAIGGERYLRKVLLMLNKVPFTFAVFPG